MIKDTLLANKKNMQKIIGKKKKRVKTVKNKIKKKTPKN